MRTIAVIFGTRPEAIKFAPVILALKSCRTVRCRVCVTGQHREMLDQALSIFGIVPDVDLKLMRPGQRLADLTSRMVVKVDGYLAGERPDLVLVQGDTTTTLCASLAAFYNRIPVGHVEAGLRTLEMLSPWPEEMNRTMVSRIASLHFAPTRQNRENLRREGIPSSSIHVTGNTVVDAFLRILGQLDESDPEIPGLSADALDAWRGQRIVLITAHRQESFGKRIESICKAICQLAKRFPDVHFVYPVHLNPNIRKPVMALLSNKRNIHLLPPLPYLPFVSLLRRCHLLLTDSGGLQEEAPTLRKPVLIMRDHTERMEVVQAGAAKLVGTSQKKIVLEVAKLLADGKAYDRMAHSQNPFGDGKAAQRIVNICLDFLGDTGIGVAVSGKTMQQQATTKAIQGR